MKILKYLIGTIVFTAIIGKTFDAITKYNTGEKVINKKIIIGVIIGLLIIIGVTTSFYQVDQTEYAVLVTLGKPSDKLIESGPHLKLPYPIQKVEKLSKETFSLTFGYKEDSGNNLYINESETKMITGDENIILADLEVQWRIVDPVAYLYNTNRPKEILYNATSASLRNVIGNSTVDDALTDGRSKIISNITEDLKNLVQYYNMGIFIVNVNLQDVDLPNKEVDEAFKAVTDAREERITKINEANKYRNEKINKVKGEQDAIISRAEGEKVTTVEKAKGDVAAFNALYGEYVKNPAVTKQRLITDTLKKTLKDAKVYVTDGEGGTVKYLPIDSATKGGN